MVFRFCDDRRRGVVFCFCGLVVLEVLVLLVRGFELVRYFVFSVFLLMSLSVRGV